jgi:hypothetical protein
VTTTGASTLTKPHTSTEGSARRRTSRSLRAALRTAAVSGAGLMEQGPVGAASVVRVGSVERTEESRSAHRADECRLPLDYELLGGVDQPLGEVAGER